MDAVVASGSAVSERVPGACPAPRQAALRSRVSEGFAVADLGAEHLEAFAHEGGEARPALGGDELAVDVGAGRRHVDIDAADQRSPPARNIPAPRPRLPRIDSVDRHQHLHAVADGEDRLVRLVEVPDDRLHALVDADVFRAAPAGDSRPRRSRPASPRRSSCSACRCGRASRCRSCRPRSRAARSSGSRPPSCPGRRRATVCPTACIACSKTKISYSSLKSPTSIRISCQP